MTYTVEYENKAFKSLMNIPKKERISIKNAIDQLAIDPAAKRNVKKLLNRPGYRLRVGKFRVLYEVDFRSEEILIVSIGHRKSVYRR